MVASGAPPLVTVVPETYYGNTAPLLSTLLSPSTINVGASPLTTVVSVREIPVVLPLMAVTLGVTAIGDGGARNILW